MKRFLLLLTVFLSAQTFATDYFASDFGARADGTTLNTVWYFALVIAVVGALINFIPKKSK